MGERCCSATARCSTDVARPVASGRDRGRRDRGARRRSARHVPRGASEFDLAGGCLVPASATGTHILFGAASARASPTRRARTMDEVVERACMRAAHPSLEWIEAGHDPTSCRRVSAARRARAASDRPVVLEASDHHTMWVNSEALRRAESTRARPTLRSDGSSGTATARRSAPRRVGAIAMVRELLPVPGPSEQESGSPRDGALDGIGITWVQEARAVRQRRGLCRPSLAAVS
jgi:predicted amidohydrolase YtcJ